MNHPKMMYAYVGIDSHLDTNTAVVLNCFFEKLGELQFRNVPGAFEGFLRDLDKIKPEGVSFTFGLEDVTAYGRPLAAFLTKKQFTVKHVNAALVAHERKSLQVLNKTDSFDAECAARVLLNRYDQLPDAETQDKYWVLSQLVTRRRLIVKMNTALKNHLQAFIARHYPSYRQFFQDVDSKTALAFYEEYPSPGKLQGIQAKELSAFLKNVGHYSRTLLCEAKAKLILECVENDKVTATEHQQSRDMAIKSIISQIKNNLGEISSIDKLLKEFLKNFDYKLETMKGIDFVTAAGLISEIGDISKFPNASKLSKYAGIAPVTYASGKSSAQYSNTRGNRVLNSIFFNLAVTVICTAGKNKTIINPYFYDYYHKKIQEGKTKRQALKCVQRRLVNIIYSMMKNKSEYINPPSRNYEEHSQQ